MAGGLGLARPERVRRRPEFERAYSNGARQHGRLMTLFVMPNAGTTARLGIAATRKLGPAVDRNRAKRLAREVFRRHKPVGGLDLIVVPRREMLDAPFATIEAEYLALLARPGRRPANRQPHRGRAPRTPSAV